MRRREALQGVRIDGVPPTARLARLAGKPAAGILNFVFPGSKSQTRGGRKHIGGYFDRETVEKVALLRARLDLDNSELIKLAIEDLHRKHMAKRA